MESGPAWPMVADVVAFEVWHSLESVTLLPGVVCGRDGTNVCTGAIVPSHFSYGQPLCLEENRVWAWENPLPNAFREAAVNLLLPSSFAERIVERMIECCIEKPRNSVIMGIPSSSRPPVRGELEFRIFTRWLKYHAKSAPEFNDRESLMAHDVLKKIYEEYTAESIFEKGFGEAHLHDMLTTLCPPGSANRKQIELKNRALEYIHRLLAKREGRQTVCLAPLKYRREPPQ